MPDVEAAIEAILTIFIVLILVYVFFAVFETISPILAWIFVILATLVIIGMLSQILRRR
jgi:hypothetical protein